MSSDDNVGGSEDDAFSDALNRIPSSDRLAALSARMSSIDGGVASRRLSSFITDRFHLPPCGQRHRHHVHREAREEVPAPRPRRTPLQVRRRECGVGPRRA
jgi:hypothetical protein